MSKTNIWMFVCLLAMMILGSVFYPKHGPLEHKPIVHTGTHQVGEKWINPDRTSCGEVERVGRGWGALADEDMRQEHYFNTESEAREWIAQWCQ